MISDPFFLETPNGRLFAIHHRPKDSEHTRGHVLCVLPFNEEMNRCRSMITQQAKAFAGIGFGTLVLDLFGTGDSEGEHADARWSLWLDNLSAGLSWLNAQNGGCRSIWGIRLGAILAASLHASTSDSRLSLMLWQPVIDGKTHLTQFLRVRIAANMDRADLPKETTSSMRQTLAGGQAIEVGGYQIHTELAAAIDATGMIQQQLPAGSRVLWIEHSSGENPGLSPASQRLLSQWPGKDIEIDSQVFVGPAFWQVHERVLAPALVMQTTSWLDAW